MTIKQQEQLKRDITKMEQFKIVNKIEELQIELHKGKIDFEEFFHKVSMFKHDLENGIFLKE